MRPPTRHPDLRALPAEAARDLSTPIQDLQANLLLYKSFFVGE